jgi:dUTP pyrophosphatase
MIKYNNFFLNYIRIIGIYNTYSDILKYLNKYNTMLEDAYNAGSSDDLSFDAEMLELYNTYNTKEKLEFMRGYFDTNGEIYNSKQGMKVSIWYKDSDLVKELTQLITNPCEVLDERVVYVGTNALEVLHTLYSDAQYSDYNNKLATYKDLLYCWRPRYLMDFKTMTMDPTFMYKKTLPSAIAPKKANITDTGYDLWLIEKVKEENGMVMYDTGIAVQPPIGYYFELVGRSSISKSGYIMANSIGIIDGSYRGSLKVALIKVNKDMPDLELPCRLVQLIPRQFLHLEAQEVEELDDTKRGDGGFGSSGK